MKIKRTSAFETNSSSCHSLALGRPDLQQLDKYRKQGYIFLDNLTEEYGWVGDNVCTP